MRLRRHNAGEHVFLLHLGSVYDLRPDVFARKRRCFARVTMGSLTVLLTVLNPITFRQFPRRVPRRINGSFCRLQTSLSNLTEREIDASLKITAEKSPVTAFGVLTVTLEHTVDESRRLVSLVATVGLPGCCFASKSGRLA